MFVFWWNHVVKELWGVDFKWFSSLYRVFILLFFVDRMNGALQRFRERIVFVVWRWWEVIYLFILLKNVVDLLLVLFSIWGNRRSHSAVVVISPALAAFRMDLNAERAYFGDCVFVFKRVLATGPDFSKVYWTGFFDFFNYLERLLLRRSRWSDRRKLFYIVFPTVRWWIFIRLVVRTYLRVLLLRFSLWIRTERINTYFGRNYLFTLKLFGLD